MIDWRDRDGRPDPPFTTTAALRWSLAALVVAALHGGGLWAVLHWKPTDASSAAGLPAILIELTPVSSSPEASAQQVAPGPMMTEAPPEPAAEQLPERAEHPPPEPMKPTEQPTPEERNPVSEQEIKIPELPRVERSDAVVAPPAQPRPIPKPERRPPVKHDRPPARRTTAPNAPHKRPRHRQEQLRPSLPLHGAVR
jgi:protein TonB